jgi:hypothetical protein
MTEYGTVTDYPSNVTDIDAAEFGGLITSVVYERQAWARIGPSGEPIEPTMFFFAPDGTGIAITGSGRMFKFAECVHDYADETIGKCYHRLTCRKCGYVTHYDTSD